MTLLSPPWWPSPLSGCPLCVPPPSVAVPALWSRQCHPVPCRWLSPMSHGTSDTCHRRPWGSVTPCPSTRGSMPPCPPFLGPVPTVPGGPSHPVSPLSVAVPSPGLPPGCVPCPLAIPSVSPTVPSCPLGVPGRPLGVPCCPLGVSLAVPWVYPAVPWVCLLLSPAVPWVSPAVPCVSPAVPSAGCGTW